MKQSDTNSGLHLTKEKWLARCANAFDMGLVTRERMHLLDMWVDTALRAGAVACGVRQQCEYLVDFMEAERRRLSDGAAFPHTLASDVDGYSLVRLAAIFSHPCQKCAEDRNAWHTRSAFCEHNGTSDTNF